MSFFMQNGDLYSPTPSQESLLKELPVGNYTIVQTMAGLMFQRIDSFAEPGRTYGKLDERVNRIVDTFLDRPRATGVLLSGEKGSGKSLLARCVSLEGYERGIPTIIVNAPYTGDAFNTLLAHVQQPAIVLMDEFEKVYADQNDQEAILTLLDGMMTSKKLFVLTVNNKYRVNEHMKNRPGRIYYSLEFAGLEPEFIREYCEDNLDDQDQIDNVLTVSGLFDAFNFDMLKALVEEMNRYKESAFDALEWLNARPQISGNGGSGFDVRVTKGAIVGTGFCSELPMSSAQGRTGFYVKFPPEGAQDLELDDDNEHHFTIGTQDLRKMDAIEGRYEFEHEDGFTVTLVRKPFSTYDLRQIEHY